MRAFLLGFLAYLLPTFPLGYLWHLSIFAESYERLELYRHDMFISFGLASMVIQAAIFSWVFPRLFHSRGRGRLASALVFGAVAALFAWSFAVLPVAAKFRMSSVADFMMLETAFTIVQFAIVAPLMALAHRPERRRAVESIG